MTIEEALEELKTVLGKSVYPAALPKVEEVLKKFEAGFKYARETVRDWYEPKPSWY